MQIKRASVVGAGTMGHGIAFVLAKNNIEVCLIDSDQKALDLALEKIEKRCENGVRKDRLSNEQALLIRKNISRETELEAMAESNFMIEAVVEDLNVKRGIFSVADALIDEDGILATNTSSLSVEKIADAAIQNHRVIGTHFFNPPDIMKLLEIVTHENTSMHAIEYAKSLGQILRKECIVVRDSPGFATSRLGISFALEAMRMLEQKVSGITELDSAMKLGYGHPMGPLMLSDWVGLDIRLAISEHLFRELKSPVFEPPKLLRKLVRAGFLGRKSGNGFYDWDKGRSLGPSQVINEILDGCA